MYKPTSCGTSIYTPGVIPEELRDQFGNACELVCIQVPKVYDSCLLRECLVGQKIKARPDQGIFFDPQLRVMVDCSVQGIINARVIGLKPDSFKVLSKKPLPGDPDRKIITYTYTLLIGYQTVDDMGNVSMEMILELRRTETVGPLYCPDSISIIRESKTDSPHDPYQDIVDADDEIVKLEIVARVLDAKVIKVNCKTPCDPSDDQCFAVFTVGIYNIVKCELIVQLVVPAFGFCPPPAPCKPLGEPCEVFNEQLPPDFFPPQLPDFIEGPGIDC